MGVNMVGNCIIDDEAVKEFLNDVSYFRLIKAYSIGLKKKNDKYNQGIAFDMIKELYLKLLIIDMVVF